jgi:hypothetical protein
MIKPVRAWVDSAGMMHPSREDACKAEFRRLLNAHFGKRRRGTIPVEHLVEEMFAIDKMIGVAVKEDTRADLQLAS